MVPLIDNMAVITYDLQYNLGKPPSPAKALLFVFLLYLGVSSYCHHHLVGHNI